MDDLLDVLEAIQVAAREKGLITVCKFPTLNKSPEIIWEGDWEAYIELAARAKAAIVYISAERFDLEQENDLLATATYLSNRPSRLSFDEGDEESVRWLSERIKERTAEWVKNNQKIGHLVCVWFKDSVAHQLRMNTSWYIAYSTAVEEALDEAEEVEEDNRQVHSQEETVKIYQLAEQLAKHERFPDAANHEKRLFMAGKLFKDRIQDKHRIVQLAEMIYWWDVEPVERVVKAQKARELRASGESIKNIQVLLRMSESKVRAALEVVDG